MVRPHDEILQNLLTSKTGHVKIASRLGFGINLVFCSDTLKKVIGERMADKAHIQKLWLNNLAEVVP
jgi:hypothetical protein